MSVTHIQQSIENVTNYLSEHPEECRYTDSAATAVVEEGLRFRAEGPHGAVLVSDMPKAIGGGGSAPSGVTLTTLEVTVDSESDDRGLLGMDDAIPAGPLSVRTRIRIGADGVEPERLRELVQWAQAHSPVGDTINRAVPMKVEVEVV